MSGFLRKTEYRIFTLGLLAVALAVVLFAWNSLALAAPNYEINYQGKLTDENGVTVADGTYNMRFWLLTSPTIATTSAVWSESLTGTNRVQVTNGLFSVMLGSTSPLSSVDFNQTLYLGVEIGGSGGAPVWDGEMSPRKVLGAVPAAFFAETAENANTVGGVASTSFLRSDQADTASGLITFTAGASSTNLVISDTATTTNLRITGRLRDSNNSAGTNGWILQTTSTGVQWVATSSLGINTNPFGASINVTELASENFGDFTCNGTTCTLNNDVVAAAEMADSDHGFFTYSGGVATLDANGLTSANLLSALSDETGTGRLVFSASPAFSGTATFSALTATSTITAEMFNASSSATSTALAIDNIGFLRGSIANSSTLAGFYAGDSIASNGINNTAFGYNALTALISGDNNTAIGYNTLRLVTADENTALGSNALTDVIGGVGNVGVGYNAGDNINSGSYNVAIGWGTGGGSGSDNNVLIGRSAGGSLTSGGDNNIIIGYQAGDGLSGATVNNIIIGYDIDLPGALSNRLNIGNLLFGTGIDGTGTTLSSGNIGIGTSSPTQKLSVAGGVRITGALYGNNNSAGSNGYVLQSTGSGFNWVSTTTLGFVSEDLSNNTLDDLSQTSLTDPNADQLVFWDDSDSQYEFISSLTGLSISGNTLAIDYTADWTGTLDGIEGANFLRSDTADTANGLITFAAGASSTNLVVSGTTTASNLSLSGRLRDGTNSSGANGYVLQSTGTGVEWVSTTTLGFGSALSEGDIEAYIFDADNTGTLSSGTLALDSLSYTGTLDDTYINDAITVTAGTIGSNTIASGATWTTSGTLTIGDGGDRIDIASDTWDVTNGVITGATYQGSAIAPAYLDTSVIVSSEIDNSSELLAIVTDETGTGRIVFSNAPAFSGTATFSALTATSTLTLSGTAANIALGSNWLSGDGQDEGVFVGSTGRVGVGTNAPSVAFEVVGDIVSKGTSWATSTASEAVSYQALTYGNGMFVALSYEGDIMTSPDGRTWTKRTEPEANIWRDVVYGNGLFVAVSEDGTNRVMTSVNGINWTSRSAAEANSWYGVTYGNGIFVAVSTDGTNQVMTSPDGINWTARAEAAAQLWLDVTYGNGLFVAVSQNGTDQVMISSDGVNWTLEDTPDSNTRRAVTYGNGVFVAVSDGGTSRIMTSTDGETWVARTAPENNLWYDVTYGDGLFVAVSSDGTNRVMTSPDGVNWVARAAAQGNAWRKITYGNGRFIAVAASGTNRVMTSGQTEQRLIAHNNIYNGGMSILGGNVGIGTSSPASRLDVWGNLQVGTSNTPTLLVNTTSGRVGIGSSTPTQELSVTGDVAITGALYDNNNSSGSDGFVLQSNGAGFEWVSTTTLGFGSALSEGDIEAYIFDADNTGTLSSGTLALDSLSYTGTLDDTYVNDAITVTAGTLGSNTIASGATWTTSGTLTIGDGGDRIDIASDTWDVTNGVITGATYQGSAIASAYLDTSVIVSSEIDNSSEILAIVTDETGTGRLVFSASPAFSGTATFSALTATSTITAPYFNASGASTTILSLNNSPFITASSAQASVGVGEFTSVLGGDGNTAFGYYALNVNTTGSFNTALGQCALCSNATGTENVAVGNNSLFNNTGGSYNIGLGSTLFSNTHGSHNIGMGYLSLNANNGNYNVAIGTEALWSIYDASHGNVALGNRAGYALGTNSSNNIFIGRQAGDSHISGSNNIAIGYDIDFPSNTSSNQLNIGNLLFGTGIDGTGTSLSSGNIGIGTSSPTQKLSVEGGVRITGALYDNNNVAGTDGWVLQSTATGFEWVATTSLGIAANPFGASIGPTEMENINFGDFTCNGDTCSLNDTYLTSVDISTDTNLSAGDGIGLSGDTLFVDVAGGLATTTNGLTTTGVLEDLNTLGAPASDGQIIVATGAGAFAYESGATARASLGAAGLTSPAFNGTATFSALTATGTATFTTVDINGGNIDGTAIGASSASTIIGTTIQANTGFMPDANDGAYLGQSGTAFSDLFLASGGVINWLAGDVTLTHSADTLTLAGGTFSLATSTQSGRLTLSGSNANIALGSNYLSGDGDDEGISVSSAGSVGIGTSTPITQFAIEGASAGLTLNRTGASEPFAQFLVDGTRVGQLRGVSGGGLRITNGSASTEWVKFASNGRVGIATSTPTQELSVDGDVAITGRIYGNNNSAGSNGYVLQSTGSGFNWVATTTLGLGNPFGSTINKTEMASEDFGSFTCNGTDCLFDNDEGYLTNIAGESFYDLTDTGTYNQYRILYQDSNAVVDNASFTFNGSTMSTPAIQLDSNTTGVSLDTDGDGMLIIAGTGNGSDEDLRINLDDTANQVTFTSNTGVTVANFSGIALQESGIAVLNNDEIDASSELLAIMDDETGTGRLVFSASPAFSGTATFSALTATGTATFSTVDINGGNIDGTAIGAASASTIIGTTITANTGFMPDSNDGAYLGQGGTGFSDLFLASGANIDFNNGDVAILHKVNGLAFIGVTDDYTFDDTIKPEANDMGALGTSDKSWSDLFLSFGGVINFNQGDVTMTHNSNLLTISGGTLVTSNATTTSLGVTGRLFDSSSSAGTKGWVLQATGTSTRWVATSTLGISGGSSQWTDSGSDIYFSTGKVGIGSSSPVARLSVVGDASSVGDIFKVASSTNATLFNITREGRVGIGMAPDTWNMLAVNGLSYSASGVVVDDDEGYGWGDSSVRIWGNSTTDYLAIRTAGTERLRISSAGNVGIGTTTPQSGLHVAGLDATANTMILGDINNGGYLYFGDNYDTNSILYSNNEFSLRTDQSNGMRFYTNTDSNSDPEMIITDDGKVGIGTSSPSSALTVGGVGGTTPKFNISGTGEQTMRFLNTNATGTTRVSFKMGNRINPDWTWIMYTDRTSNGADDFILQNRTGTVLYASSSMDLGIGSTNPLKRLQVQDTVADDQFRISYDADDYADFQVDSTGDLIIDAEGGDVNLLDENLSVCTGGACPSGLSAGTGNALIEGDLFVDADGATGLGQATSTFSGDVLILGKLDVGTIDPIYRIGGVKYATYGVSSIGVKEEAAETLLINEYNEETGYYERRIAWSDLERGSDLWLFRQITDFGILWEYLSVSLTAGFDGRVFYKKDVANNALLIQATRPGEVSARFMANRFDWSDWGNLRKDQEVDTAHFELGEKE